MQIDPDKKLYVIYLLDSIIKNVGGVYLELFSKSIVNTFCNTFEIVDNPTRLSMINLLKTWLGVFPQDKVTTIQDKIKALIPASPAAPPVQSNAIHVNPRYLQQAQVYLNILAPLPH